MAETIRKVRQRSYRDYVRPVALVAPILIFAIPMGIGNNLTQPLSLLALLPVLYMARAGIGFALPFMFLVISVSAVQASQLYSTYSLFQLFRYAVPFTSLCIVLAGYQQFRNKVYTLLGKLGKDGLKVVEYSIFIFSFSQFMQSVLFNSGVKIANFAAFSEDAGRILLYPTTSSILIFFYAAYTRRIFLLIMVSVTLLETGSKAVLISAALLFVLSILSKFSLRDSVLAVLCMVALYFVTMFGNTLVIDRLGQFFYESRTVDLTREAEIYHAYTAWMRNYFTILFGNGLMVTVSPGILTPDPTWAEYSKYDIENGYWAMLTRVGMVGSIVFLYLLTNIGRNIVSISIFIIWIVFSFKTSYQFFTTFDGVYLLFFGVLIEYSVRMNSFKSRRLDGSHHPWSSR